MQRSFNLLKEASKNSNVYLCTFNQKAWLSKKEQIFKARKKFEKYCKAVKVVALPSDSSKYILYSLVAWSFLSTRPYTVNWVTTVKMRDLVNDAIVEFKPDIIHCDTIGLDQYVPQEYLARTVLNHHNIESQMMVRRANKEQNILRKLYFFLEGVKLRSYEKRICPLVGINIVVSELDRCRLLELVPTARTEVVKNGVDISYFSPMKTPIIPRSLVFAGSMDWYPNEDAVIYFIERIWPIIKNSFPDASFTVAGRKPSRRLKQMARCDVSIELTGFVEDIRPPIDQAEVYVCPIRDGGGTKLKLLDAMAMGKPIVTTTVGAEGLGVRNGEHVLIGDNPETFASAVCSLFSRKELRRKLAINARQFVEEHYAWEIIGRDLLKAYQNVRR